jgi:hypothetical protein
VGEQTGSERSPTAAEARTEYSQSTPQGTRVGKGERTGSECVRISRRMAPSLHGRSLGVLRGYSGGTQGVRRGYSRLLRGYYWPCKADRCGANPTHAQTHVRATCCEEAPPSTTPVALVGVRSTGAGSHGSARTATIEGAKRALRTRTALSRYSGQRIIDYKEGAADVGGSIRPHTLCVCLYARVCACVRVRARARVVCVCVRVCARVCVFECVRGRRCHVRACASGNMCCVSVRAHPHAKVGAGRAHGHARVRTRALCVSTACPSAPVTSRHWAYEPHV